MCLRPKLLGSLCPQSLTNQKNPLTSRIFSLMAEENLPLCSSIVKHCTTTTSKSARITLLRPCVCSILVRTGSTQAISRFYTLAGDGDGLG